MGSVDLKVAEARIRKLKQIEVKKGYEFKQLQNFINFQGTADFYTKRAITYRKNYMEELEKYKNFDNYNVLTQKLKSIKNPNEFYELIKSTGNIEDLDLYYQSNNIFSQIEFNSYVERILGNETNEGDDIVRDFMDFKYEAYKGNQIIF